MKGLGWTTLGLMALGVTLFVAGSQQTPLLVLSLVILAIVSILATIWLFGVILTANIQDDGVLYQARAGTSARQRESSRTIPSAVKREVWARDGGCCVLCGASDDLHFDHEIPFSKGGASTTANVRILCAHHNLRKGAKIE